MFFVFNLCIAFQVSGGVNREIKRIHIAIFQTDERAQSANWSIDEWAQGTDCSFTGDTQLVSSAKCSMRENKMLPDCHKRTTLTYFNGQLIRLILWCSSCLTVYASTTWSVNMLHIMFSQTNILKNYSNPFQLKSQDYSRGKLNLLPYKQRETMSDRCEWEDIEIIAYPPW